MKKTIKNIFALFLVFASITSCEDKLELGAQGSIDDSLAFQTVNDLVLGLNGVYGSFGTEEEIEFNSRFSDNVALGLSNGGFGANEYNWILNPSTGNVGGIWRGNYYLINEANRVLEGAENIVPSDEDLDQYNSIVGQLYALRADAHLRLVSYYTENYSDDALSVFKLDFVPGIGEVLPRLTNGEIFAFINEDIARAESLISDGQIDNNFITKDYVTGIKARMATLRGNTSDAILFAQELIDKYDLATVDEYKDMFFSDTNDTEVILRLKRTDQEFKIATSWYFLASNDVKFNLSNSLFNEINALDVRRDVIYNSGFANGGPSTPDNLLINKYPGQPGTSYLNDMKVMRVSEMYLIKAEAQALSNDFAGAANTIKEIRDARFGSATTADVYTTIPQAIEALLDERRKELAFEGFRYLDVKRLGGIIGKGFERDAMDCDGSNCTLLDSDYRFTFPIPQAEINVQPSLPQNFGY
jgi:hypothetical protein